MDYRGDNNLYGSIEVCLKIEKHAPTPKDGKYKASQDQNYPDIEYHIGEVLQSWEENQDLLHLG